MTLHGPDSEQTPIEFRCVLHETVTRVSMKFRLSDGSTLFRGEVFPATVTIAEIVTQWIGGGAAWGAPIIDPEALGNLSPTVTLESVLLEVERRDHDDER